MKLLLACEFYYPSRGGVQEVMRQVAERLAARGHDITVVTSTMKERNFTELNGVKIRCFSISGNRVHGLIGEVDAYRDFVREFDGDAILIKAVQQWSFDALWDVLPDLSVRKVLIPCGFAGIQQAKFFDYYRDLPRLLRCFDRIIVYGNECRDASLITEWELPPPVIIPNGADYEEFSNGLHHHIRQCLKISEKDFLILTVGSITGLKGHLELARAFVMLNTHGKPCTLILNGNSIRPRIFGQQGRGLRGLGAWAKQLFLTLQLRTLQLLAILYRGKKILITDLPRVELIDTFLSSNLFVFASRTEYSPLVLYEACAAGLPFLSVPVGNAAEIARWTGGGMLCDAPRDVHGFTRVEPPRLARSIETLIVNADRCKQLGDSGRAAVRNRYNWDHLSSEYESLFRNLTDERL